MGEAVLNLGLSVGLMFYYRNVVCVAIGSLVATFVFGWFIIWPWAAREANLSTWKLARTVLIPTWLACLPIVGVILLERYFTFQGFRLNLYTLLIEGALVFLLAGICMWRVALNEEERSRFSAGISKILNRGAAAS